MPIREIVENEKQTGRFPRIAKLRKGEPKRINPKTGKEIVGRDQDFFRITFEQEFEYLLPVWTEMYGEKPTEFSPVVLDAETVDDALDFWYEDYDSAETLLHRCDGKFQHLWYDRERGAWNKAQIACAVSGTGCACTPKGRMNLIFPDFIVRTGTLGYIAVETGSLEDIRTLRDRLRAIQNSYGTLKGVHVTFGRAKRKVNRPEVKNNERTGKRIKTTSSMLYLLPTPEFTSEFILPVLTGAVQPPALPEPQQHKPLVGNIDTDSARKLLGNGGGVRRLGTEEPEQGNGKRSWTHDPATVKRFVDFVCMNFNLLGTGDVLAALNSAVDYEVNDFTDWQGSEIEAVAATIAFTCNYDLGEISDVCAKRNVAAKTRDLALALAQRWEEGVPAE